MKKNTIIILYGIIFFLLHSNMVQAVSVKPAITSSTEGVIAVTVVLDPEGRSINAVSGSFQYDPLVLEVRSVRTTNSIISLWIERPVVSSGSIAYSGVVIGGFDGVRNAQSTKTDSGILFTVLMTPRISGVSTLSLENLEVYANDENATALSVDTTPLQVSTDQQYKNAPITTEKIDHTTNANLAVSLFRNSNTENKWFVAFTADTNRATVLRYEVAQSLSSDPLLVAASAWRVAKSPFVLNDQLWTRYVHVRAIAENGQVFTTTTVPKDFPVVPLPSIWTTFILIFLILAIVIFRKPKRSKKV